MNHPTLHLEVGVDNHQPPPEAEDSLENAGTGEEEAEFADHAADAREAAADAEVAAAGPATTAADVDGGGGGYTGAGDDAAELLAAEVAVAADAPGPYGPHISINTLEARGPSQCTLSCALAFTPSTPISSTLTPSRPRLSTSECVLRPPCHLFRSAAQPLTRDRTE